MFNDAYLIYLWITYNISFFFWKISKLNNLFITEYWSITHIRTHLARETLLSFIEKKATQFPTPFGHRCPPQNTSHVHLHIATLMCMPSVLAIAMCNATISQSTRHRTRRPPSEASVFHPLHPRSFSLSHCHHEKLKSPLSYFVERCDFFFVHKDGIFYHENLC